MPAGIGYVTICETRRRQKWNLDSKKLHEEWRYLKSLIKKLKLIIDWEWFMWGRIHFGMFRTFMLQKHESMQKGQKKHDLSYHVAYQAWCITKFVLRNPNAIFLVMLVNVLEVIHIIGNLIYKWGKADQKTGVTW